jgi:hypothetical protein
MLILGAVAAGMTHGPRPPVAELYTGVALFALLGGGIGAVLGGAIGAAINIISGRSRLGRLGRIAVWALLVLALLAPIWICL